MRQVLGSFGFLLILGAAGAHAQEHVASQSLIQERVQAHTAARDQNVAILDHLLSSDQSATLCARFGTDSGTVRRAVSNLSDAQLQDLASRAARLQGDPVAGLSHDVNELLIIFLIVAIVLLVLKAVD